MNPLPIDTVLPELVAAVRESGAAVLRAPTGAGKTTRVPPALLDAGLAGDGAVVMLEPRRVAARAAARWIAHERGTALGREVGYHVRFDRRASATTRILVVTEGVLLRMLQDDPFLDGIGAVVLDEFHERGLNADLALALVQRVRTDVRPDLRVVVMSATLDTAPLATYLDAPVIESEGFLHPVSVRHLDQPDARPLDECAAAGVRRALQETDGDVLAFLPGVGEIRGTESRLHDLIGVDVHTLYGDLPPGQQDAALRAGPRRRVVLATNVAETSVTVEGVTAVVDTGRARVLRHDPARALDELVLTRIARSSIEQRAGRAGRTAPGTCYRLWTRNEERDFPDALDPEVRRVDLAGAALTLLDWGESDLAAFPWFEAPDATRLVGALDLLRRLDATRDGRVTDTGRAMARLPAHPRIARMLVAGHRLGRVRPVALAAAVLSERDPARTPGRDRRGPQRAEQASESDVLGRMDRIVADRRGGAGWVRRVAARLAEQAESALGPCTRNGTACSNDDEAVLRAVFAGFPDRLARRRAPGDRRGVLVSGRGVRLAEESTVAEPEFFVCVDIATVKGADALVRAASGVRREWLPDDRVTTEVAVVFDESTKKVRATRRTRFDELVLDEVECGLPKDGSVEEILADAAGRDLAAALPLDDPAIVEFRARVSFLRASCPELDLPTLTDDVVRALLPSLVRGKRSYAELERAPLLEHLKGLFNWERLQALDAEAPERLTVPSGNRVRLRYEEGRPPVLAVRIQEMFGLRETPTVARRRVKVLLHLLAPNQRAQQVTDDLPSFWANTYPGVRAELRRRYPRHAWPEDPLSAPPERRPQRRRAT